MIQEGRLSSFADLEGVGEFSRNFHAAFVNWPLAARFGAWSTWRATTGDANYLLLEIAAPSQTGELCEPVCVYDEFEEVTVGARAWHDHFPQPGQAEEDAVSDAMAAIENWLAGEFVVCVFYQDDTWKGSMTKRPDESLHEVQRWLTELCKLGFEPNRLEVRGAFPSKDIIYPVVGSKIISAPR